jgi:hypothetical protein
LLLLVAAYPEIPPAALAQLSIGRRDAYLLALREAIFGSHLVSLAVCPTCHERLELTFDVADIRAEAPLIPLSVAERGPGGEVQEAVEIFSVNVAGYEVRFRLPNSLDLTAVAGNEDVTTTPHLLLERCLLRVSYHDEEQPVEQLPAHVIEAVAARMAQVDPQAEVLLALTCPLCGQQWQATFDIVSFFWSEINAWAYRLLHEVHTLASAYGWCEADILAMSPWRRQFYLEMVSGA